MGKANLSLCPINFARPWKPQLHKIATAAFVSLVALAAGAEAQQRPVRAPTNAEARTYAGLIAMTDARELSLPLVDSALSATWAPLRAAASLSVGQVGAAGKPGAARLRSLLNDPDPTVASNAAYALGLLVDTASVPALATAMKGRNAVAREAAWALGEIGAPARAALIAELAVPGQDEARTIQLLLAAAKLRPVPVAEIRPYLRMTPPSILWAASYAIARPRAPAGVRDLISLATNPTFVGVSGDEARSGVTAPKAVTPGSAGTAEVYVYPPTGRQRARAEIARGLALAAAGDSLGNAAVAVLLRLAADPHPHVRINAVRSLATYGVRGRDAVVVATRDVDANVRVASAQSLATVLDSTSTVWTDLWQRDTSLMYRSSVLASAVRVGASLPELSSWVAHRDWRYRFAAAGAISGSTKNEIVARGGRDMLRDADPRVRAAAFGMLSGNDTAAPPASIHAAIAEGLRDPDFTVREIVLGILGRHAKASDVALALDAYARAQSDALNDARIAAIGYVASAWRRDSAAFTPDVISRIRSLAVPADPQVRAAARNASVFSAWPERKGNVKPLRWYQNLVSSHVVPALRGATQRATIRTTRGDIVLELFGADAPITVWNFMNLARTGYYRGSFFHRVVPNFVAQDGDPRGTGSGGPGYAIRDEMNPRRYDRGALGMALSGPDTGGSQYFIAHSPQPHLDGHYTVFGRVLRGYDALDALVQGDRILSVVTR
ncbi:MAG TPA: peptidylprolyl isomerase [Gemmatimonadaceae bacterium]|nr:peptidylprolyl isomerase [Gemmatimonadaceae bacterium]